MTKKLANYEKEMLAQAEVASSMEEGAAGGQFFSVKNGQLSFNDAPMPDNQMGVIIIDSILENVHYEGDYDPDKPQAPNCFAHGRVEKDMVPHESIKKPIHKNCIECPAGGKDAWGSADKGKGKACGNTRRLAMIPAGTFNSATGKFEPITDIGHYEAVSFGFLKLPITSVKGYATMVRQIAGTLGRPPHGIFTKVSVVPDVKTQYKVIFEPLSEIPNNIIPAVMKRHEEAKSVIDFPYTPMEEVKKPKKGKKGKY